MPGEQSSGKLKVGLPSGEGARRGSGIVERNVTNREAYRARGLAPSLADVPDAEEAAGHVAARMSAAGLSSASRVDCDDAADTLEIGGLDADDLRAMLAPKT